MSNSADHFKENPQAQKKTDYSPGDFLPTENIDFSELAQERAKLEQSQVASNLYKASDNATTSDFRATEDIDFEELQRERALLKEQEEKKSQNPYYNIPSPRKIRHSQKNGGPPDIPPYFIDDKLLGEGAEAEIYLAFEDKEKFIPVGVVKVSKPGHEKQIYKEIEFARRFLSQELFHDNIVSFINAGMTPNGLPFMVSEYLSPFPRKKLHVEDAFCIITKMAQALSYLHKKRIYHRDVKPTNIKFTTTRHSFIPKLFDFGTITNQINDGQTAACSPYFASPEVLFKIRGHSDEEPQFSRVDVYSLGLTFLGFLDFNPYLALEPDLEKKISDVRGLIDYLIKIHKNHSEEFFQVIEQHLKKEQKWTFNLQESYGIRLAQHEDCLEKTLEILRKVLHLKPEERPKSQSLASKLEAIFSDIFGIPIDDFMKNGGSLFPNGPQNQIGLKSFNKKAEKPKKNLEDTDISERISPFFYKPEEKPSTQNFNLNSNQNPWGVAPDPNAYYPYPPQNYTPPIPNKNALPEVETKTFKMPSPMSPHTAPPPDSNTKMFNPTVPAYPQNPSTDSNSSFYPPYPPVSPPSSHEEFSYYQPNPNPSNTNFYYQAPYPGTKDTDTYYNQQAPYQQNPNYYQQPQPHPPHYPQNSPEAQNSQNYPYPPQKNVESTFYEQKEKTPPSINKNAFYDTNSHQPFLAPNETTRLRKDPMISSQFSADPLKPEKKSLPPYQKIPQYPTPGNVVENKVSNQMNESYPPKEKPKPPTTKTKITNPTNPYNFPHRVSPRIPQNLHSPSPNTTKKTEE